MKTPLLLLISIAVCAPGVMSAASVSIEYGTTGDDAHARVMLDSEGSNLNVIEGSIALPQGYSVRRIEHGAGVFPFWVIEPTVENDVLRFAGMAPGGFEGVIETGGISAPGELFTIYFEGIHYPPIEQATFAGYLHDGVGTPIEVDFKRMTPPELPTLSESVSDLTPPQAIDAYLVPQSDLSPPLLVARASDEAGINRYEVSIGGSEWEVFTSPREVSLTEIERTIVVRAFDSAGNYREVVVQDIQPKHISQRWFLAIGALILLVLIGLLRRRRS